MMSGDDFAFEGTDMTDYHAYRDRVVRESALVPRIRLAPVVAPLQTLGIDIEGFRKLMRITTLYSQTTRMRVRFMIESASIHRRPGLVMIEKGQLVSDFVRLISERMGADDLIALWLAGTLLPGGDVLDDWYHPLDQFQLTDDASNPPGPL
jgi:hypothetical protein